MESRLQRIGHIADSDRPEPKPDEMLTVVRFRRVRSPGAGGSDAILFASTVGGVWAAPGLWEKKRAYQRGTSQDKFIAVLPLMGRSFLIYGHGPGWRIAANDIKAVNRSVTRRFTRNDPLGLCHTCKLGLNAARRSNDGLQPDDSFRLLRKHRPQATTGVAATPRTMGILPMNANCIFVFFHFPGGASHSSRCHC